MIIYNYRETRGEIKMRKFELNKTYKMRSICDHECIWTYEVIERTAQTITITDGKKVQKCRVAKKESEWCGAERIYPLGKYSMAPALEA